MEPTDYRSQCRRCRCGSALHAHLGSMPISWSHLRAARRCKLLQASPLRDLWRATDLTPPAPETTLALPRRQRLAQEHLPLLCQSRRPHRSREQRVHPLPRTPVHHLRAITDQPQVDRRKSSNAKYRIFDSLSRPGEFTRQEVQQAQQQDYLSAPCSQRRSEIHLQSTYRHQTNMADSTISPLERRPSDPPSRSSSTYLFATPVQQ